LNVLPVDIELLYPAQFGNDLVLTPHTYLLNAATVLTNKVFLDAQGNPDAVFVIKINGALSTSTYSKVKLINGAQAKNVFWKIEGAVGINNYSVFRGTIICNNGALGALNTGVKLFGRALTTTGALSTVAITAVTPTVCCPAIVVQENLPVTGYVGAGESECKNALQTITVAGSGTTFSVYSGGSVNMVAGQNIRILNGIRVYTGGYLHGYITETGSYCCGSVLKTDNMASGDYGTIPEMEAGAFFKVYPNATSDRFYVELDPAFREAKTVIQMYGMVGDLILKKTITGDVRYEFSLGGKTPGIYFVRVMSGDRLATLKIVKK
jgi:hypothetical protein